MLQLERTWLLVRHTDMTLALRLLCGAVLVLIASSAAVAAGNSAHLLFVKASASLKQRHYVDAVDAFNAGLRLEPDNAMAHFYDGVAYAYLGKNLEAQNHLYMSLALQPNGVHADQAWLIVSELRRQPMAIAHKH